ncbi:MAG TPA: DUF4142 domain-containing protein [Rhizomicrobium sp.]|nr:DUF4142 domain-containing protein [Rhizomicrobium sp.]
MARRLAILVLAALAAPSLCAAKSAGDFLSDAIKGDNSEIALGKMAASKATSVGVRVFGQTLARDHSKAKAEAAKLATDMRLKPPEDSTPDAQAEQSRLRTMAGPGFDREFVRYMIDDHRKDIVAFEQEARKQDGAVSALARRQLPTLRHHLDLALAIGKLP